MIDNVLLSNDKPLLQVMALGFGLLALIQVVVKCVRSWLIIRLNCAINIQMGANLFHHLVRLPLDYFEKRHIGDVVSRFGSLNTIREFLTQGIIESLIDGLMAIVVLIMMYVYSPSLTFLVIGFVFVSFVIQMAFYYPNRRVTEESIVAGAKEDSIFLETIRGIQTIKLFSHETARQNTWLNRYAEVINTDIRMGKLSIAEESLENSLNSLELILVIYFGALIVMEEQLSVGMLIAFLAYRSQFTSSIFSLIDKLITFKLIGLHLDRLSDITFEETENDNGSVILPHSVQGHIKVSNLWFRYSDNTDWIPTSHLDSDNEKTINVNINQLKITKVVIAHRKETIRSANRIINITPDSMT